MRILQVVPVFQKSSGVATFAGEVANLQSAEGHEVVLATLPRFVDEHYPVSGTVRILSISDFLRRGEDVDVIHIHGIWTPILHAVVKWACRRRIPIVWSLHGMLAPWALAHKRWKKGPVWHLWQRRDLARAAVLHATSDLEEGWIRKLGFRQRIAVVPLGTHLPQGDAPESARRIRATSPHVLLFVGRVYPVKGLDRLLRAWARVDRLVRADWRLRIVGPDQDGYMAELQKLSRELGLCEVVDFVGEKQGAALEAEYQGASCLVLPSHTENFGGVVVDALARGVPVIASTNTPWREIADPRARCGWWSPNDPEYLADTLAEMMALPDATRDAMGVSGRTLVDRKYAWQAVEESMIRLYAETCGIL